MCYGANALRTGLRWVSRASLRWPLTAIVALSGFMAVSGPSTAQSITINIPGVSIVVNGVNPLIATVPGVTAGLNLNSVSNGASAVLFNQVSTVNGGIQRAAGSIGARPFDLVLDAATLGSTVLASPGSGGASAPATVAPGSVGTAISPNLTFFAAISGQHLQHEGYAVTPSGGTTGRGPAFRETDYSVLPSLLYDASSWVGARNGTLKLGVFAGYATSILDFGATADLERVGISHSGSANFGEGVVGGYGLVVSGNWYAALMLRGGWGDIDIRNDLLHSTGSYGTSSFTSAATTGVIVPVASGLFFDTRTQLGWGRLTGRAYVDSAGLSYGQSRAEALTGVVSGKLFSRFQAGNVTYRPFVQLGVSQRFHDVNDMTVGATTLSSRDAATTGFVRSGLDLEISDKLQMYFAVRSDFNRDLSTIGGQVGVTIKLD